MLNLYGTATHQLGQVQHGLGMVLRSMHAIPYGAAAAAYNFHYKLGDGQTPPLPCKITMHIHARQCATLPACVQCDHEPQSSICV